MLGKFKLSFKFMYIMLTSHKKTTMIWVVSHKVESFVAGQPLPNGILFTSYYHTVRIP